MSEDQTLKSGGIELIIPLTPNFIRVNGWKEAIPVSQIDAAILRKIGKQWTEAMIKKSRDNKHKIKSPTIK